MLSDYWVIALLLSEAFAILLLMPAAFFSWKVIAFWNPKQSNPYQIYLEQKTYLLSAIVQMVLLFQIINLLMFLYAVNQHLPPLIKGAMCATGTLAVNDYGYASLYMKLGGIFLYGAFLMMNFWDNQMPNYPLTPRKYDLITPIFIWVIIDWVVMLLFFLNIEPNIIATCCSVNFSSSGNTHNIFSQGTYLKEGLIAFASSFILLSLLWLWSWLKQVKNLIILSVFAVIYVLSAVYVLKFFFVKYIYGLPTHTCLFDIFWIDYYYIGYWIFLMYYLILLSVLFLRISTNFANKTNQNIIFQKPYIIGFFALQSSFWTVWAYWYFWQGTL